MKTIFDAKKLLKRPVFIIPLVVLGLILLIPISFFVYRIYYFQSSEYLQQSNAIEQKLVKLEKEKIKYKDLVNSETFWADIALDNYHIGLISGEEVVLELKKQKLDPVSFFDSKLDAKIADAQRKLADLEASPP